MQLICLRVSVCGCYSVPCGAISARNADDGCPIVVAATKKYFQSNPADSGNLFAVGQSMVGVFYTLNAYQLANRNQREVISKALAMVSALKDL